VLEEILGDEDDDLMVRHEAAEALGAIGHQSSLPILTKYSGEEEVEVEVRETCELAIGRIEWMISTNENEEEEENEEELDENPYNSVDPTPPSHTTTSTPDLREQLLDDSIPLFLRYRAMFSLRNRFLKVELVVLFDLI